MIEGLVLAVKGSGRGCRVCGLEFIGFWGLRLRV